MLSLTDLAPKLEEDRTSPLTLWMLGHHRQSMYTGGKRGCGTGITKAFIRAFHLILGTLCLFY